MNSRRQVNYFGEFLVGWTFNKRAGVRGMQEVSYLTRVGDLEYSVLV